MFVALSEYCVAKFERGLISIEEKVIKPYHLFEHHGGWYVINIEGMLAGAIDAATAGTLAKMSAEPAASLESQMEDQLAKMGLLSCKHAGSGLHYCVFMILINAIMQA